MNVIYGEENLGDIQEKHTTLELDTIIVTGDKEFTVYAVIGPGDIPLGNFVRLSQFIPVHEALIKNYKEGNLAFCVTAIAQLRGNIDSFMDTFYEILLIRIQDEQANPTKNWTSIVIIT